MAIGFIGTGKMGAMLVRALLRAERPVEEEIWASNRSQEKLDDLRLHYPRLRTGSNGELAEACGTLFLCVRPGDTAQALEEVRPLLTRRHLLVSISNVVELERLAEATPCRTAKVIPSFTQFVHGGVSLLIPGPRSTDADLAYLRDLLEKVSRTEQIEESQSRAATNVVSCGPAFLARFCTEWAAAAYEMQPDISLEQWESLVWDTVRAAADLPRAGIDGREMLEEVSTPGGMTYEGLLAMDAVLPEMWREVMRRTTEREKALKLAFQL
ncbi:NAD(P)-binding domain-containing protein [uncultured Paludibaculum sp.]|uniref:NAD(P)-binding domain-containing protein n=1 Tax=uncultured Paludibaculum sp. TaxID=1765020 RepID=UPI002AABF136|nr:NAD(P)-binding domain-containing protein [uncultured Paludibaculum sp.]